MENTQSNAGRDDPQTSRDHPETSLDTGSTREMIATEDETELTSLHPNYVKALRLSAILTSIPFLIAGLIGEVAAFLPWPGLILGPIAVIAMLLILRLPMRRYTAKGYNMSTDRLRVVRGIWWRSDTVVPFGRVQHIDVEQGPIERSFGIATMTLHTAGSHNASVHLPGLEESLARAMREEIRAHIKRDTM
jgi:membrane protein YdbS with pleckstrin-like domain